MKYKLIALDVDGTLFNSKREITEPVKAAIAAAQAKGVYVTISTGRGFESAKHAAVITAILFFKAAFFRKFNNILPPVNLFYLLFY